MPVKRLGTEEPDEGNLQVRVCGGERRVTGTSYLEADRLTRRFALGTPQARRLSLILNGKRNPTIDTLELIDRALRVAPEAFI